MDAHLAKNSVARGAMVEDRHPIDTKVFHSSDVVDIHDLIRVQPIRIHWLSSECVLMHSPISLLLIEMRRD